MGGETAEDSGTEETRDETERDKNRAVSGGDKPTDSKIRVERFQEGRNLQKNERHMVVFSLKGLVRLQVDINEVEKTTREDTATLQKKILAAGKEYEDAEKEIQKIDTQIRVWETQRQMLMEQKKTVSSHLNKLVKKSMRGRLPPHNTTSSGSESPTKSPTPSVLKSPHLRSPTAHAPMSPKPWFPKRRESESLLSRLSFWSKNSTNELSKSISAWSKEEDKKERQDGSEEESMRRRASDSDCYEAAKLETIDVSSEVSTSVQEETAAGRLETETETGDG
eukprot:Platyproteum_vivax@DN6670_c0_g1_i1.p1